MRLQMWGRIDLALQEALWEDKRGHLRSGCMNNVQMMLNRDAWFLTQLTSHKTLTFHKQCAAEGLNFSSARLVSGLLKAEKPVLTQETTL